MQVVNGSIGGRFSHLKFVHLSVGKIGYSFYPKNVQIELLERKSADILLNLNIFSS